MEAAGIKLLTPPGVSKLQISLSHETILRIEPMVVERARNAELVTF